MSQTQALPDSVDRKVLVTGGRGLLATELLRTMLAEGVDVRASSRRRPEASPAGVEWVEGDFCDPAIAARLVAGVDAVYHLAAVTRKWAPDRSVFERVNVEGAVQLAKLAADAGVRRFVHVSSFTVFGPTDSGALRAPEHLAARELLQNDYQRSKRDAHEQLLQWGQTDRAPVVIAAPGVLFGPSEHAHANPVAECMAMQLRQKFRMFPGGGAKVWPLAFLPDVARGLLRVRSNGEVGTSHLLAGHTRPLRDVFAWVESETSRRGPQFSPPLWPFLAAGKLSEAVGFLTRRSPRLTRAALLFLASHWSYSSDDATREVGYQVTEWETALMSVWRHLYEEARVPKPPSDLPTA